MGEAEAADGAAAALEAEPRRSRPADDRAHGASDRRLVLAVAAASGALAMLYEVAWSRLLALVLGASTYAFSIMLLSFIGGIALGSLAVSRLFEEGGPEADRDPLVLLAWVEIGVFAALLPVIPLGGHLPYAFAQIASILPRSPDFFPLYLLVQVAVAAVLMLLPAFFMGMALPLCSRVAVDRLGAVGRRVGSVFSVNIAGSVLGAGLTGLVLLPGLGLQGTFGLGLLGSAFLAAWLAWRLLPRPRPLRAGVAAACLLAWAGVVGLFAWNPLVLNLGLYRFKDFAAESYDALLEQVATLEVVEARDDADSTVAVLRRKDSGNLYLKVNGKTDAGTGGDMSTQLWLGHLGMLLNPKAEKALVIGLGSGVTCGAVLRHPGAAVDAVEISEAVVDAARTWFSPYNGGAVDDPRLRLFLGDAKELFKLLPEARYDVIVSEPSNPWMSGIGNLFTREFFAEVQAHLRKGGLLVQWVHVYELSDELFGIILNTLSAVFAHVEIWEANPGDMLIVAAPEPIDVDPEHLRQRLADPRIRADINRQDAPRRFDSAAAVLGQQVISAAAVREAFPGAPPWNLDRDPLLEYRAPRAFFANARAEVVRRMDERLRPADARRTHLARLSGAATAPR